MQAFPSCGVIRGRKFNVQRDSETDENPQRSEEAHRSQDSEQDGAEINIFFLFSWIKLDNQHAC
jgi:hypothetical protein